MFQTKKCGSAIQLGLLDASLEVEQKRSPKQSVFRPLYLDYIMYSQDNQGIPSVLYTIHAVIILITNAH